MGILDQILSAALGGAGQQQAAPNAAPAAGGLSPDVIMRALGGILQNSGGLDGLVSAFNTAGLGNIVSSWIGTGQNQPISTGQLTQVLGTAQIGQIAQKLGLDHGQASNILAQMLPHVVDQLTPQGQVQQAHSQGGDLLNAALGALTGKLFGGR